MKILGIIPARGGSKGVPKKNIKILGSKPLIEYTIEEAKKSKYITKLIISTDDLEIVKVAKKNGVLVPFIRPENLSNDTVPMIEVLIHSVDFFKQQGEAFDAVCLLQPTTPFRTVDDIDNCIELMQKNDVDTVITTVRVPDVFNPYWVYIQENNFLQLSVSGNTTPRRQDLPLAYGRAGSVYLMKTDNIMIKGSMYGSKIIGYEIPFERNINIDTLEDWIKAENYLKEQGRK